jgi:60 kDa SS-A/Ro ribonucleoprotein
MNYAKHVSSNQDVRNNQGGIVFEIDKWSRLERFLVLGSEGGTYYVGERELTRDNAKCISECIKEDAKKLVDVLVDFSVNARAPSQNETFFALAITLAETKGADRRYASEAIVKICRTGSHILQLAALFTELTGRRVGSSRALAAGFKLWYEQRDVGALCFQTTKYPSRNGWSHGDLIRAVHPKPNSDEHAVLMGYLDGKIEATAVQSLSGLEYLDTKLRMHAATDVKEVLATLDLGNAVWEMVPTQWLNEAAVWEKLLDKGVPMTALMRNLGRLSKIGLVKPLSAAEGQVCVQLTDPEQVRRARMHPYNVLVAQRVYASGRGFKGSSTWTVSQEIVEALEDTYEAAFGNVVPSGKRHLLGIDLSASMTWPQNMVGPLQAREAAAAMAMITKRLEPACYTHGFSGDFMDLAITRKDSLSGVIAKVANTRAGPTDCAIPMLWAGRNKIEVDTFVIYTDNETGFSQVTPAKALQAYRQATGIDAKLVVVGMTATQFSIADPTDAGMLDVVGFDSATPGMISSFAAGGL